MKKTEGEVLLKKRQPAITQPSEFDQVIEHSKLADFLSPTKQKRAYLLLFALFLGVAFSFIYVGGAFGYDLVYWAAYWLLIALSFPSFLLWQGYGLESLSKLGVPFYIFTIIVQTIWLYIISCSLALIIRWKKVDK